MGEEAFFEEYGGNFDRGSGLVKLTSPEFLKDIKDNQTTKPIYTRNKDLSEEDQEDQSFQVWEFPQENHIYLAGVDVSLGVGECSSTIQIIDVTDLYDIRQVAEYQSDSIAVEGFSKVCVDIFNRYNQCYASVERNGSGGGELVSLIKTLHNYKKLVRYHHNDTALKTMEKENQFGINAHNNEKKKCIGNIRHYLNVRKAITIRSERLYYELNTFVKKDGKGKGNAVWAKSSDNVHDDLVDSFNWAFLPLHHDLTETYFVLTDPKYDESGKPKKILHEKIEGDDRSKYNDTPLNSTQVNINVYFGRDYNQPQQHPLEAEFMEHT